MLLQGTSKRGRVMATCSDVTFCDCQVGVAIISETRSDSTVDVLGCAIMRGGKAVLARGPIAVRVVACSLNKMSVAGIAAANGADVTVERCLVADCSVGLWVFGLSSALLRDCHLETCGARAAAVRIGDTLTNASDVCRVGGIYEKKGRGAALAAVYTSGTRIVSGARCAHEIGVSAVAIERVVIEGAQAAVLVEGFGRVSASGMCAAYCGAPHVDAATLEPACTWLRKAGGPPECSVVSRREDAAITMFALQHMLMHSRREVCTAVHRQKFGVVSMKEKVNISETYVQGRGKRVDGGPDCIEATHWYMKLNKYQRGVCEGELVGDWITETLCQLISRSVGEVLLLALLTGSSKWA